MKLSPAERKAAQNRWKAVQRRKQKQWRDKHHHGLSAEAIISAEMRGECTITWNSGTAAKGITK